jgi:thiosulfate dehydrogenase
MRCANEASVIPYESGKDVRVRSFLLGVATVIVVGVLAAFALVWFGYVPAAADAPPPFPGEKWAANHALDATIAREAPKPPYVFGPSDDAIVVAGAKGYIANCSVCHGSAGSDASKVSKGLYVPAPQFAKHGVDDDPEGVTYWKIEHGIRFTGMPSFKGLLTEEQIWQITFFLKHGTGNLPAAADAVWHQPHGD